jgi:hypothetical protein
MGCESCGYDATKIHKWPRVNGVPHCPQCESEVDDDGRGKSRNKDQWRERRKEKERERAPKQEPRVEV